MLSKEELNHLFYIEAGTLYWKNPIAHRCSVGDIAGYKDKDGYMKVRFSGHLLPAHKIVWAMTYGEYPELIDHINGVRTDNSAENLRVVTKQENGINKAKRSDNSSGVTGVRWHKQRNKWNARIKVEGKEMSLGMFADFDDAVSARLKAELEHFGKLSRNYASIMRQVEAGTLVVADAAN
jgi:hypothetical protein